VQVRFHATLRQVVGGRLVEVPFAEGMTVSGLIDDLLTTYPALRPQLFDGDGQLHRHVHVFVNGRDAPYLSNGMDTVLGEDTNVDIFPPVGGGAR
jgi:molybdopterin synthase sulfur carrier subunit